jgi:thiamine biosynthesis lipoprotein
MITVLVLTLLGALFQQDELSRFEASKPVMGVEFGVILYAKDRATAEAGFSKAFAKIDAVNEALSDYQPDSEINRLCRGAPHEKPVEVSEILFEALSLSKMMHEHSDGAFDVTIGPASRVWREARKQKKLPGDDLISEAKARMGMEAIVFETENPSRLVSILKAEMQLDFGGIGKGLAADRAMEVLRELGIKSALINASGDVFAGDAPPNRKGWTIQIPSTDPRNVQTMTIANQAVATSGDVFQYLEVDGVRYSHIVDPKTAEAVSQSRIVTVVCQSGAKADALASALSVMGREGFSVGETLPFEAQIIQASNRELTEFEVFKTDGFEPNQLSDTLQPQKSSDQ